MYSKALKTCGPDLELRSNLERLFIFNIIVSISMYVIDSYLKRLNSFREYLEVN